MAPSSLLPDDGVAPMLSCYPSLDHPAGRLGPSFGQGGCATAGRFSSSIGRLLPMKATPCRPWPRNCDRTEERLCRRYRRFARAGKVPTIITAAIARELADFIWAIAKQAQPVTS